MYIPVLANILSVKEYVSQSEYKYTYTAISFIKPLLNFDQKQKKKNRVHRSTHLITPISTHTTHRTRIYL